MNKNLLKPISYFGLFITILPAFLFFAGMIERSIQFNLMVVGMFLWFGTAIFWIKPSSLDDPDDASS